MDTNLRKIPSDTKGQKAAETIEPNSLSVMLSEKNLNQEGEM